MRPGDLAAIVAGLGPGPFTGLRVGLVTAASMGHALGIPTYGVCSLDALGRAAGPGRVLVATDARRREVYCATYAGRRARHRPGGGQAGRRRRSSRRPGGRRGRPEVQRGLRRCPIDDRLLYPPGAALVALAAERVRRARPRRAAHPALPAPPRRRRAGHPQDTCCPDADRAVPLVAHRRGAADRGGPVRRREVVGRHVLERAGPAPLLPGRARRRRRCSATPAWPSPTRTSPGCRTSRCDRDAQRRGIGRALLEALLAEAARRGVRKILLEVAVDNAPAQQLYATYDFEPVGIRRGYYQPSNTDALVMMRSA